MDGKMTVKMKPTVKILNPEIDPMVLLDWVGKHFMMIHGKWYPNADVESAYGISTEEVIKQYKFFNHA